MKKLYVFSKHDLIILNLKLILFYTKQSENQPIDVYDT